MSGSCKCSIAIHNSPLHAYGATRSSSGTLPTDRTFTGQKQAPRGYPTGLLYYNARYYDPALGLFISPDTLVPDAGVLYDYNRFMYGSGNRVIYTVQTPAGTAQHVQAGKTI
jgi:RHS repeat-associated protein